jgi:thiol-disulfide isomerase/thioredoxin
MARLKKLVSSGNTVVFNHAHWCGHCQVFKPEWSAFKEKNKGSVNIVEIESAALDSIKNDKGLYKRIVPSDGSVYFPMIIVFTNGVAKSKKSMYEGSRTSPALTSYVSAKIASSPKSKPSSTPKKTASKKTVTKKIPTKKVVSGGHYVQALNDIMKSLKV